ncbi:tripartite tricarboxylate transporter substrate binding protein [Pusillimonas sp. MFBS29]|uniref:Bug family tripartite tricarboxylate transporter substrate binding protein n=1 Tax=Pusillimonas sp. MFBS29 TaxID=2886690 RepID=UPI001D117A55|nr:tripartite tricarboxylate transporter substrate binding protein [Pusillimonas sp. MFBS29]MCC2596164.1 tripartite tricarboxylate transporter substrate binding protein [Pusillimonas sp. MFBS29]
MLHVNLKGFTGALSLSAAACMVANPAWAQSDYPSRPITLITPYSTGGDSDMAARNFSAVAFKYFKQPVVVLNKPGASGVIGSEQGRTAEPDGYTLLLSRPGSQAILPAIAPTQTKYKWDDFTAIGLLELNPYGCYVKGDSPYKTYKDFEKALREKGPSMNYGTAGTLTTNSMGPRVLFSELKLGGKVPTQIPYKGTGEATSALLAGQVDFSCSSIGPAFGLINAGNLRALFVTTPERLKSLPDVPTAKELGLSKMNQITGWSGISGPPNMPAEIVEKIRKVMEETGKDQQWISATENAGSVPYMKGPEEARKFIAGQFEVYHDLGKELDIIDKTK